eukprot:361401-Chlamydomonas_euryale.AAC.7
MMVGIARASTAFSKRSRRAHLELELALAQRKQRHLQSRGPAKRQVDGKLALELVHDAEACRRVLQALPARQEVCRPDGNRHDAAEHVHIGLHAITCTYTCRSACESMRTRDPGEHTHRIGGCITHHQFPDTAHAAAAALKVPSVDPVISPAKATPSSKRSSCSHTMPHLCNLVDCVCHRALLARVDDVALQDTALHEDAVLKHRAVQDRLDLCAPQRTRQVTPFSEHRTLHVNAESGNIRRTLMTAWLGHSLRSMRTRSELKADVLHNTAHNVGWQARLANAGAHTLVLIATAASSVCVPAIDTSGSTIGTRPTSWQISA